MTSASVSLMKVQLSRPGRIDSDKCLIGHITGSVCDFSSKSKDMISLADTSSIKEHDDFIDNSL